MFLIDVVMRFSTNNQNEVIDTFLICLHFSWLYWGENAESLWWQMRYNSPNFCGWALTRHKRTQIKFPCSIWVRLRQTRLAWSCFFPHEWFFRSWGKKAEGTQKLRFFYAECGLFWEGQSQTRDVLDLHK